MDREKIWNLVSLEGKVAIITGGAGRLGIKHAEILKSAGAKVVSFDVADHSDELEALDVFQLHADITKPRSAKGNVDFVVETFGSVDILINNAAFNPKIIADDVDWAEDMGWLPYEEFPLEQFMAELEVGLIGAQNCTQAVSRHMISRNSGCVVNIGSTSAITVPDHRKYKPGRYKSVAYPVVKAAVVHLAKTWAAYFAMVAPNIRCNALSPGAVNFGSIEPEFLAKLGERNMLRRPARPNDYQGALLFLCSDASSFMTGQNLIVDGGQTSL